MPTPPLNMIQPYGQTAIRPPSYPSFLPTDNSMATGLTPAMQAQIAGTQPQVPQTAQGVGMGGPTTGYQQIMDFMKQLGGGQMNFGGGGLSPSPQQILASTRAREGVYDQDQVRQAARAGFMGIPMMPNIPRPTPGAGGQVAAGDVAAYNTAKNQAVEQNRNQLARLISSRKLGGKGWSPHRR